MQITPSIEMIRHSFRIPVSPGVSLDRFVNSYIVYGETITLIDTGVSGSGAAIFDAIRSRGRDPSEIAIIVLTHSHPDHIGGAREIREETDCCIAAHPAERTWIENVELQNHDRPVPGFSLLVGGSVKIDREIRDGDIINPGNCKGTELNVYLTPGHSPGSVSLFMPEDGALFSGDAIPVPGDLPVYDDPLASAQSVQRLIGIEGIRVLLSAWDEQRNGADAYLQMNCAIQYLQQIHAIVLENAMADSDDLMEITRKTAAALGLPRQAVNPLLARTFAANLKARDRKDLTG